MHKKTIHKDWAARTQLKNPGCTQNFLFIHEYFILLLFRGHRGRDRMVGGFTTTRAISAYHN